jgi:flagellin-like hook-associated protein FlgL
MDLSSQLSSLKSIPQKGLSVTVPAFSMASRLNHEDPSLSANQQVDAVWVSTKSRTFYSTEQTRDLMNAISYTQTQKEALGSIGRALERMVVLANHSRDPEADGSTRADANKEFQGLLSSIIELSQGSYNGKALFQNRSTGQATAPDGARSAGATATTNPLDLGEASYAGVINGLEIGSTDAATAAAAALGKAITQVGSDTQQLTDRTESLIQGEKTLSSLLTRSGSSGSSIAPYPDEVPSMGNLQVLLQTGSLMLAQANTNSQMVASLLR